MKNNIDFFKHNKIDAILSFSSGLYASENAKQILNVESHVIHDACNKCIKTIDDANVFKIVLHEMNGFMKISQIKNLLEHEFIHLALHGCCHLKLENENSIIKKFNAFKKDLNDGIKQLQCNELQTDMFVYPYVYSFPMSDRILKEAGFKEIIGSKTLRMSIENIYNKYEVYDS